MKIKKAAPSAWKKNTLEVFRYLFFAGYLLFMTALLYGASFFYTPGAPFQTAGEKL